MLTPNYIDLNNNPRLYQSGLAAVLGQRVEDLAWKRKQYPSVQPIKVDLAMVAPLLDKAAMQALAIVNEKRPHAGYQNDRSKDWHPYRREYKGKSGSDYLLLVNADRIDTYTRCFRLFEAGKLDQIERHIASGILFRLEGLQTYPAPLNEDGLALLDDLLVQQAKTIKPMLAKQAVLEWLQ